MYEVPDKDTMKSEILPHLSVEKRGYVSKRYRAEVIHCTSYLKGVFILCWHHKDNKLLSSYRKIKSQDDFFVLN